MTTFGITRSKNEDDIIAGSIWRMLRHVDHIIIGDNSTDNTRPILDGLVSDGLPITLFDDDKLNFEQRDVMTAYAHLAQSMGAEWVVPFDIDEVWYVPGRRIGDALAELPDTVGIVSASNTTHCVTSEDPDHPDPMVSMGWRNHDKLPLAKVACRCRHDLRIDHGNHAAMYRDKPAVATVDDLIEIRHFPYRTPEQFIKRVSGAWPMLRDSGLPEWHGAHMWHYGRALDEGGPDALRSWFLHGMYFTDPANNPELVYDPCP